ncbi:hypothetical protein NEFER03_0436 [Nematocida sp. LUAm3]|nr:hypothetical protein NEFER03_0436 [Nematocida sp. LUAm3]KAI5175894.1 hypothetical protein NEFER02_1754 [Nematocida sp. LUAm2]KAI5178724.1 hypothetical protein NEFER01_1843 [Nematocida sp. LUAm1]
MLHIALTHLDEYAMEGSSKINTIGEVSPQSLNGSTSVVSIREFSWWMCFMATGVYFLLGIFGLGIGVGWVTCLTGLLFTIATVWLLMRFSLDKQTEKSGYTHFSSLLLLSGAIGVCGVLLGNLWIISLFTILLLPKKGFCYIMTVYSILFGMFLIYLGTPFSSLISLVPLVVGMAASLDFLLSTFQRNQRNLGFLTFFLISCILLFSCTFLLFSATGLIDSASNALLKSPIK